MKRPEPQTEKQFNAGGIFFTDNVLPLDADKVVTLIVEIAAPGQTEVPEFGMKIANSRGVETYVTDWKIEPRGDVPVLAFKVSVEIPEIVSQYVEKVKFSHDFATSFLDLCYYTGGDLMSVDHKLDTVTPLRDGAKLTHLGAIVPSHFVDVMIDALGKLNDTMFNGTLEESVVYLEKGN